MWYKIDLGNRLVEFIVNFMLGLFLVVLLLLFFFGFNFCYRFVFLCFYGMLRRIYVYKLSMVVGFEM